MEFANWTPDYFVENETECLNILNIEENWKKIPFLNHANLDQLKDLRLVRFRGMIQDMYNPEIYLEKYEVISIENDTKRLQSGKYRDILQLKDRETVDHDSPSNEFGDRKGYFVITVPGVNKWVEEIENLLPKKFPSDNLCTNEDKAIKENGIKRNLNDDEESEQMQTDDELSKKLKAEQTIENKSTLSVEFLLNSPIPSRPSKACMVKIYTDSEDYQLGTVIDLIGFLSVNPSLDFGTSQESEENNFRSPEEMQVLYPPPSLIPRLHAIAIKRLLHCNPLLDKSVVSSEEIEEHIDPIDVYKDLHLVLSQCLFGDQTAADYLICHLLSSVYGRTEITPLGKFALNISHIPQEALNDYSTDLYSLIEMMVPASHYFPATIDNLKDHQFFPKEDTVTNKLVSGLLQLAPHTHFVFDETKLTPGQLGETGFNAIKHLSHIINSQQIQCIFQFFQTEYNCDIPILILSEVKSLLPKNFQIPLKIDDAKTIELIKECFVAARQFLQSRCKKIRKYITSMKLQEFKTSDAITSTIQEDFVQLRRDLNVDIDYLHNLMVLSRLLGLAKGKSELDEESWKRAIFMENERNERIKLNQKRVVA